MTVYNKCKIVYNKCKIVVMTSCFSTVHMNYPFVVACCLSILFPFMRKVSYRMVICGYHGRVLRFFKTFTGCVNQMVRSTRFR